MQQYLTFSWLCGRYGSVSFVSEVCMTLHGIAGYFESTLYADEMLSIAPHSHTDGWVCMYVCSVCMYLCTYVIEIIIVKLFLL